ncbi:MAG: heme exporter protein [Alphaproteobacteria bacterium]|jgi:heme exporter protein D|nr:heme exporter protein [Alphaproteobacteria bacterium]
MDLGTHAGFILAAYAVAVVAIGVLIAWVLLDYRKQQRILAGLEARGVTRRSERANRESP